MTHLTRLKHVIRRASLCLLSPYQYEWLSYVLKFKRIPNLRQPVTYTEKICHRKVFDRNPIYIQLADKYAVREFVRQQAGAQLLKEVYFVGDDPAQIPFDDLPGRFVLKATHGSGADFVRFVEDKHRLGADGLAREARALLQREFGYLTNEWWYTRIHPRVLIEERLDDSRNDIPLDYKFLVFHGSVHLIQVDTGRYRNHTRVYYDRNWNPQRLAFQSIPEGSPTAPPPTLAQMIEVAECLGGFMDYVRVDLYSLEDGRVIFGELTFSPEGGMSVLIPREWDWTLGALW